MRISRPPLCHIKGPCLQTAAACNIVDSSAEGLEGLLQLRRFLVSEAVGCAQALYQERTTNHPLVHSYIKVPGRDCLCETASRRLRNRLNIVRGYKGLAESIVDRERLRCKILAEAAELIQHLRELEKVTWSLFCRGAATCYHGEHRRSIWR